MRYALPIPELVHWTLRDPGMRRRPLRALGAPCCIVAALIGCTPYVLSPPPAPAAVMHTRPPPERPPAEGEGTVTLDVTAGSAQVELVTPAAPAPGIPLQPTRVGATPPESDTRFVVARALCQTPCTVNLPRGQHQLQFTDVNPASLRQGSAVVQVGPRPSMVLHAMGRVDDPPSSAIRATLTFGGIVFGIPQMVVGSALWIAGQDEDGFDLRPAGRILLGTGLVLSAAGVLSYLQGRSVVQLGSTRQWTP